MIELFLRKNIKQIIDANYIEHESFYFIFLLKFIITSRYWPFYITS